MRPLIVCFFGRTHVWRPREPCGASPSMDEGQREQNPLSRAAGKKRGFQKPAGWSPHGMQLHIPLWSHAERFRGAYSNIKHWLVHFFLAFVCANLSAQQHLAIFTDESLSEWRDAFPSCRMTSHIHVFTVIYQTKQLQAKPIKALACLLI